MKRVLFVDDNNLFRQSLALVFNLNTDLKESVEADSLAEARRVLGNSNYKPDLAIVDLNLAGRVGFKLIEELRMTHPDVPVMAIALGQDADGRDRALRAGAEEVLTMAASPKEIVDAAKRLVGV